MTATNDFFDNATLTAFPRGATARAEAVDAKFTTLTTGLDKLPTEDRIKRGKISYATSTGSANAYLLTLPYVPGSYADGDKITFKANFANTGAATINVNGLGVKSLRRQNGDALASGDIPLNKVVSFRYNSTSGYFEMRQITTGSMADVATVAGIAANVTTVAGISANVTTVAGISANTTTVAGISGNVTTVAGISASVSTVAANDANITAVAGDATDIGTVATSIADVNTVAAAIADVSTVAADGVDIGVVAGITTDVQAVAPIAADVTTVAGISTEVSNVAANTVGWNFSTTTTMADPGSGIIRLNNATLASVTAIAVDDLDSLTNDVSAYVLTWDDSTSTNKGTLTLRQGAAFAVYTVTGLTDNAGWTQLAVTHVASAGSFANATLSFVGFSRAGDAGSGLANVVEDTTPQLGGALDTNGKSINYSNASIAAHATTMDPWLSGNYVTLTGGAVTFTALANAPQAGAEVELYMNAAHVFTDGAVFEVDGNVNYTATIGDRVILRAKSTTVFSVHIWKADGTAVVGGSSGISNVVTAATATTLTATPTLLQITPASYGVAVTLPDATTCNEGGPLHIIDNKGAYPVKVMNSAGTLKGFIPGGVVSHVLLIDNSTAGGVWSIENGELAGATAQLLSVNLNTIESCIALDTDRDFILAKGGSDYTYGVVYRRSTNTFGAVTIIRAAATGIRHQAILQTTNQVLIVSCTYSATAFEAVICSINASTDAITPNTAATTTLSDNITGFADGCGLIQVGTSFITAYGVATPAAQIREITVSGTTPTINAATVLSGTATPLIVAGDATHVIAVSTATTHLYTKPYTIGGLSAGTGTDTNSGTMTLKKLAPLGTRWYVGYNDGGTTVKGGIISLSGTTTTITVATLFSAGDLQDAAVVNGKVSVFNTQSTDNCNILTDSAGTASAGTAITTSDQTTRQVLYVDGTDVYINEGQSIGHLSKISCSGGSPVLSMQTQVANGTQWFSTPSASNAVLSFGPEALRGTKYARTMPLSLNATTSQRAIEIRDGHAKSVQNPFVPGNNFYRGVSASECWQADGATGITKQECVA